MPAGDFAPISRTDKNLRTDGTLVGPWHGLARFLEMDVVDVMRMARETGRLAGMVEARRELIRDRSRLETRRRLASQECCEHSSSGDDHHRAQKYTAQQLQMMLKAGHAMPNANGDPSFPVADAEDLGHAVKAAGRAGGSHAAVKAHIIARAKALKLTHLLPPSWSANVPAGPSSPAGASRTHGADARRRIERRRVAP